MAIKEFPDNLQEVIRYFSDPDVCVEFLAALRWPDGVAVPRLRAEARHLPQDSPHLEVQGMRSPVLREAGHHFRGFACSRSTSG